MKRREFCARFAGLAAAAAAVAAGCANPTDGYYLEVDERLCIGCGECAKVCNGDAITVLDNKAFIDMTRCVECGKCVKVCPYDAIS